MTPREVSKELRRVAKEHKDDIVPTFGIRISDMAEEAADAIDSLQYFVDFIGNLPCCNTCGYQDCGYKPGLGETIRYNCPFYIGPKKRPLM